MSKARRELFQEEAALHDQDAAAIGAEIEAVRRRADIAGQMAAVKRAAAAAALTSGEASRLGFESDLALQEQQILQKEGETLEAERRRALAQGATAREKSSLAAKE
jgi:hypothetical protein